MTLWKRENYNHSEKVSGDRDLGLGWRMVNRWNPEGLPGQRNCRVLHHIGGYTEPCNIKSEPVVNDALQLMMYRYWLMERDYHMTATHDANNRGNQRGRGRGMYGNPTHMLNFSVADLNLP